jgi:hypothetical protein
MRTQGFILVWAKISLHPVDSAAARVALHRSARSRGYKLSRERADHKSLWWHMSLSSWSVRCVLEQGSILIGVPPDVASASPFIVPKGRAHVTFVVKKRNGEKTKEKNKMVASSVALFLLIWREHFTL